MSINASASFIHNSMCFHAKLRNAIMKKQSPNVSVFRVHVHSGTVELCSKFKNSSQSSKCSAKYIVLYLLRYFSAAVYVSGETIKKNRDKCSCQKNTHGTDVMISAKPLSTHLLFEDSTHQQLRRRSFGFLVIKSSFCFFYLNQTYFKAFQRKFKSRNPLPKYCK